MTEIFREVDEALRYDRLKAFWRKRKVPIIVAIILLLAATAAIQGWRTLHAQRMQRAAETFFQEITATPNGLGKSEIDEKSSPLAGGYRFLLPLHRAREAVQAKNWEAADRLLAEILQQRALPDLYRDYAHLQRALVSLGRTRLGQAEERLRPLIAEESSPFQPLALFLQASLQIARGQNQAAHKTLDKALLSPMLAEALRERIEQVRSVLRDAP